MRYRVKDKIIIQTGKTRIIKRVDGDQVWTTNGCFSYKNEVVQNLTEEYELKMGVAMRLRVGDVVAYGDEEISGTGKITDVEDSGAYLSIEHTLGPGNTEIHLMRNREILRNLTEEQEIKDMDIKDMLNIDRSDQTALNDLINSERGSFGNLGVTEEVLKVVEEAVEVILEAGEMKLSDMTGGRLPDSKIDHVFRFYPIGHFSREIEKDIPEINYEY